MPNPTDPDRCPSCRAEMHPLAEHTCPRTKAPSARELEARVKSLEAGEVERDLTIENLQERMEGLEVTLHALAANHENTGVARGDGSARQPLDSRGSPAPEQGDRGTKHGEPSTQALGELRSVEACGKEPATVAYKLTDEERMAFWRMLDETGFDAADVEAHVESLVTRAVRGERERCVRFLKRRASTEYQGHDQVLAWAALGSAADAIEHGGGLERNAEPRDGECPSPAASTPTPAASGVPERPYSVECVWTYGDFMRTSVDVAKHWASIAEEQRAYCLALESLHAATEARLAEFDRWKVRAYPDVATALRFAQAKDGRHLVYTGEDVQAMHSDRDTLRTQLADMARAAEALFVQFMPEHVDRVSGTTVGSDLFKILSASRAGGKDTTNPTEAVSTARSGSKGGSGEVAGLPRTGGGGLETRSDGTGSPALVPRDAALRAMACWAVDWSSMHRDVEPKHPFRDDCLDAALRETQGGEASDG